MKPKYPALLLAPGVLLLVLGAYLAVRHDVPRLAAVLLVAAGAVFIGLAVRKRPPAA